MEYTVDIHGEINDKLVGEVVSELRAIYDFNCKMLDVYVNPSELYEAVELDIDTPGGLITGFMQIRKEVDKLKELGVKISTYVSGTGYSCGFLLALLGETRDADELVSLLYHRGGCQLGYDKVDSNARYLEHQKGILDNVDKFIMDNTNITEDLLDEHIDKDWYMDYGSAMELGILTKPEEVEEVELTIEQCVEIMKQNGYKVKEELEDVAEEKPKTKKKVKKSE